MGLLYQILEHNARFVAQGNRPTLTKAPAKKIALFTCMDTRLVEFLEPSMGFCRGDANVIKNAGNTIIDPTGGVMRSLVVAVHALGCAEILVIGHRDCGMAQIDAAQLRARMLARGVPAAALDGLQPGLKEWLGAFADPSGNVSQAVGLIRASPFIPADVPVHGLMFDPVTGGLELVEAGYPPSEA